MRSGDHDSNPETPRLLKFKPLVLTHSRFLPVRVESAFSPGLQFLPIRQISTAGFRARERQVMACPAQKGEKYDGHKI